MTRPTRYWLMKSEADCYSIEDLRNDGTTYWNGVRNYQARNFMTQDMAPGDLILFYHSNADPPGVAGIARVSREAYPDFTAWNPEDEHFDPASPESQPRWFMVDVTFVEAFPAVVGLPKLRETPELADLLVLKKGQRLSIMPVEPAHFERVVQLGRTGA